MLNEFITMGFSSKSLKATTVEGIIKHDFFFFKPTNILKSIRRGEQN